MDDNGSMKPFRSDEEKLRFLFTSHYVELVTPLPCETKSCLNMATVANAGFNTAMGYWCLFPRCKQCIAEIVFRSKYASPEVEANDETYSYKAWLDNLGN